MKKIVAALVLAGSLVGSVFAAEVENKDIAVKEVIQEQSFAEYVAKIDTAQITNEVVAELNKRFNQLLDEEKEASVALVIKISAGKISFDKEKSVFVLVVKNSPVVVPTDADKTPAIAAAVRAIL